MGPPDFSTQVFHIRGLLRDAGVSGYQVSLSNRPWVLYNLGVLETVKILNVSIHVHMAYVLVQVCTRACTDMHTSTEEPARI